LADHWQRCRWLCAGGAYGGLLAAVLYWPLDMESADMTKYEALKLALEALEDRTSLMKWQTARDAVREALAQPEERYFCQRCGKPVNLTTIHTCTPPIAANL